MILADQGAELISVEALAYGHSWSDDLVDAVNAHLKYFPSFLEFSAVEKRSKYLGAPTIVAGKSGDIPTAVRSLAAVGDL